MSPAINTADHTPCSRLFSPTKTGLWHRNVARDIPGQAHAPAQTSPLPRTSPAPGTAKLSHLPPAEKSAVLAGRSAEKGTADQRSRVTKGRNDKSRTEDSAALERTDDCITTLSHEGPAGRFNPPYWWLTM